MNKTNSPKKKSSAQTKKLIKEKPSIRRKVSDNICRLGIEYSDLDGAIKQLQELKVAYSETHTELYIDSVRDPYSDSYSLWLKGYRYETDREVQEREERAYQDQRREIEQYERLKAKYEK